MPHTRQPRPREAQLEEITRELMRLWCPDGARERAVTDALQRFERALDRLLSPRRT